VYYIILSVIILIADQLSKNWAVINLKNQGNIALIPGFIGLRYVENTGAAFSILSDKQLILIVVTFLILGALTGLFIKALKSDEILMVKIAYSLTIAGATGNFIDRIRQNYVVDFFKFEFVNFPIFNVADIAIVAGIGLLAIATLFYHYEF